jgi:hypothetical protein
MENKTFQKALEIAESLSEERRDRLAQSIKEAREEYKRGRIRKGTVDDLMNELSK